MHKISVRDRNVSSRTNIMVPKAHFMCKNLFNWTYDPKPVRAIDSEVLLYFTF